MKALLIYKYCSKGRTFHKKYNRHKGLFVRTASEILIIFFFFFFFLLIICILRPYVIHLFFLNELTTHIFTMDSFQSQCESEIFVKQSTIPSMKYFCDASTSHFV